MSSPDSLRVLFVTNMWPDAERPWYGAFVKSQYDSLVARGHRVDVLAIPGYRSRREYLSAVPRLRDCVAGYDIVHAHYGHAAVVARLQRSAPVIVSYCGDDVLGTRQPDGRLTPRSRIEAHVFRQLARVVDATITKSIEMHDALPAPARRRDQVIPNGVDLDHFRPRPRDEARRELGWLSAERVALFVGNPDVPSKNFPLAREACDGAARVDPDVTLRVAWGYPPASMPLLLAAADALLLPSLSEGSPNCVKEALAMELPVVATAVGDVPDRLAGVPASYAGPADPDRLARALLAAFRHGRVPEARAAVQPLSLGQVARQVEAVYLDVLGRSPGARGAAPAARYPEPAGRV
jgi:glycosyltransferase involved in cell wall biosynthesis